MTAHRATILAAGAASLMLAGVPAAAQADRTAVLNILVECAKIDDPTARLACYDNNIRAVGGTPRQSVPGAMATPQGAGAPIAPTSPQGFGYEDVRTPDRFQAPAGELQEISSRVTSIRPREPGIYLLTLEDGAQWLFAEGVSATYRLPRAGSTVGIERGSLGSYLMRFEGQSPVPVRRVR